MNNTFAGSSDGGQRDADAGFIGDGTDPSQRVPLLLDRSPFGVDEAGFAERVAMSAALARQLRFIDLNGSDNGDWQRLFDGDESLVLARIAAVDLDALQAALLRDLASARPEALAQHLVRLAHQIDRWWKALAGHAEPAAVAVREQMQQLVLQQLCDDLAWVAQRFKGRRLQAKALPTASAIEALEPDNSAERIEDLSPMWHTPTAARPANAASEQETLRAIGFAFLGVIGRLKALAAERLAESLRSGRHEPAASLLMAFLQIYGSVQAGINRFSWRHVEFYYRDCLGLRPAAAEPEALHLVCQREARAAAEFVLPGGALFDAGKDAAGRPIAFRGDSALTITEATVAALYTLRLERDPLISPERDFGFVTRIKAARLPLSVDGDPATPARADQASAHADTASAFTASTLPCHPLFGGSHGSSRLATDARLGLAIATPVLHLGEGEREIRLRLRTEPDDGGLTLTGHVDAVLASADAVSFRERLGRLFVRWLIGSASEPLTTLDLARLREAAAQQLGPRASAPAAIGDPLHLIQGEGTPSRELLFGRLVNGMFDLKLTTARGWWAPAAADVVPHPEGGLLFTLRLRREDPPIIGCDAALHGEEWPTTLPVLRLDASTQGRLYAYSLLSAVWLHEASVTVQVRGIKDLVLRNDLGRLDPSRPFHPFGPLPTTGSYLVFGAPEIARKHLLSLTLHLEWSGLPTIAGGFGSWYRGYAPSYVSGMPSARLALLREGQWQDCAGSSPLQGLQALPDLFATAGDEARLVAPRTIEFDTASVRKHGRANRPEPLDGPRVQGGLFRLQLAGPAGAFGHAAYPMVLADAVSQQARRRRPASRPNPPYTPLIERLWLDYQAADSVSLENAGADELTPGISRPSSLAEGDGPSQLFHLHPFGMKLLRPVAVDGAHGLLPRFDALGHLCIGIAASSLRGPLTLLFHLHAAEAADPTVLAAPARTQWSYLKRNTWCALAPSRVLSDGTAGFLSTGIVTLDLPPDLDADNDVMPRGLYWLRLSADHGFEGFAGLHAVHTQAVRATRVLAEVAAATAGDAINKRTSIELGPNANANANDAEAAAQASLDVPLDVCQLGPVDPRRSVAGLAGVATIGSLQGGRLAQQRRRFYASAGERLQHKQRASNAWDYERLVLERFSRVAKVKCFTASELGPQRGARHADLSAGSSMDQRAEQSGPPSSPSGEVLVVVVPELARNVDALATTAPRLDANELREIHAYLAERASPWVRLRVRNASYERIQVRCTVLPARGTHEGVVLRRVQQAIVRHLSPWFDGGCQPRFHWLLRCEEVQAHLRSVEGVEAVSQLSLLQVACGDDGRHTLGDTARASSPSSRSSHDRLHPLQAWSLALPMPDHLVIAAEAPPDPNALATGIRELAIGSTFIIGGVAS